MATNLDFSRQEGILNPVSLAWPLTVIGLGGIGGAAAPVLAKLGFSEFCFCDPDTLEIGNIPSQFMYRATDVGKAKVIAACEIIRDLIDGGTFVTSVERATEDIPLDGIVVSGVDSMASRYAIWNAVCASMVDVPLYLDGRIGGEILQLYTVRPPIVEDCELYEEQLFPDSEVAPLPCTARAIIHPAIVLAGLMAAQITRWIRNEPYYRTLSMDLVTMRLMATDKTIP